jgi:hypothetical protein
MLIAFKNMSPAIVPYINISSIVLLVNFQWVVFVLKGVLRRSITTAMPLRTMYRSPFTSSVGHFWPF